MDADACPAVIKAILYRAAERLQVGMTLVANQPLHTPPSPFIRTLQVPRGFGVADNEIAQRVKPGDLVITADIPLASDVIDRGAHALDPRGELYTPDNIRERLQMRNFMDELRGNCSRPAARPRSIRRTGRDSPISSIAFSGEPRDAPNYGILIFSRFTCLLQFGQLTRDRCLELLGGHALGRLSAFGLELLPSSAGNASRRLPRG